jgi:hypothetical protein
LYPREGLEVERPFAPVAASSDVPVAGGVVLRLRRSRCSAVSSVPGVTFVSTPSLFDPAGELERCEESAGDVDRVVGG